MDRRGIPLNFMQWVVLLCWRAHAAADGTIATCMENGIESTLCGQEQTQRRAQNMVFSNHAADEQSEQEDEDDADLNVHMQMRLNLDIPVDGKAEPQPKGPDPMAAGGAAKAQQEASQLSKGKLGSESIAAKSLAEASATTVTTGGQRLPAALSFIQLPDRSSQASPNGFSTGNQMLLGAAIGAVLVIVGALLATALRNCATRGKGVSDEEVRAAAKVWMLDWALGYDPDDKEEELVTAEVPLKLKKKQPPMATPSDCSSDTDEEEPEAESDEPGEMLADAVFVAEQVEVANEAMDAGYGRKYVDCEASLSDAIRCDLR